MILRALALNPDDRFSDANSMAAALIAVQAEAAKVHSIPAGIKNTGKLLDFYQQSLKEPKRSAL